MKNLEKLLALLSSAIETYEKCEVNIKDKTAEVNCLSQELSELNLRTDEIARLLSNANKGIGIDLSMDELCSLKKELEDKNNRIHELQEFIPSIKNSLHTMAGTSMGSNRNVRHIKDQITNIIADKAAAEIATISTIKSKELVYASMSLYGLSFTGKPEEVNNLYQRIGERLCKQIFSNEDQHFVLPTAQQSIAECDEMIENLS